NGEARLRRHGARTAARTGAELALGKPVLEPAQIGQPAHTANISHTVRGVKSPLGRSVENLRLLYVSRGGSRPVTTRGRPGSERYAQQFDRVEWRDPVRTVSA